MGTDTQRGVDDMAAAHRGQHDVEDLEDGAGHSCSNPSSFPSSLDTWRYPVHAGRTGLEVCTPTAVYTSSQMRIDRVTQEQSNLRQIADVEKEMKRLQDLLHHLKSQPDLDGQQISGAMCNDPRTATGHS